MTLEQIQEKADSFFEFPTENKDHVTTTSAVLFARECCKEAIAGRTYFHSDEEVEKDLEFAFKRSMVLANMLKIPVHESPKVTGTILGLVRGAVERLQSRIAELEAAILKTLNENGHLADGDVCTLIDLKRAMSTWELE